MKLPVRLIAAVPFAAVFVTAILVTAQPAVSAEPSSRTDQSGTVLEEIVVTATRSTEEVRKVPAAVTVITEKEIKSSGALTLVEVLEKVEGIQVRAFSGNSPQAMVDMRGFGGENPYGKTLVLLDGRRLNRPDMASVNWFQIPLSGIERVEVVRGASSVLYGDAALGGVINIITKKGGKETAGYATVTGGSYGLHDEKAGVSGRVGKLSYAVNGENYFSLGYRRHSTVSSQNAGADFRYDASDAVSASLGVSFNHTDYELPGNLTRLEMASDRRQIEPPRPDFFTLGGADDDGRDRYTNLHFKVDGYLGEFGRLEAGFLYGDKRIESNIFSWASFNDTRAETYGFTPKYVLERPLFGLANKITAGVDVYREPYRKEFFDSRERRVKTGLAEMYKDSLAFYVRDELSVLRNLILSVGYRTERAVIGGDYASFINPAQGFADEKKVHHGEAFEAGLTWLIGEKSSVFAKAATVYRFPFLDEQASFNGFGGTPFSLDIEKEDGRSYEAGAQFHPADSLKIAASVFRIDMENEIAWNGLPWPLGRNENLDRTRHDGVETSFSWKAVSFARVFGGFTWHKATFEAGAFNGKEIPLVPNRMARLGVELSLPFSVTVRPEVRYVGASYLSGDNDNSSDRLESFTVYDLYVFYRPEIRGRKLTVFFGAENLTNALYSSFGVEATAWSPEAYYPMPERTFKGGLSFEF